MMNFFKRTILSITRRKNKTLLLFLIVFFLGNFIAVSFAIQNTTETLKTNIKSGLGAVVTIHAKPEMSRDVNPTKLIQVFKEVTNDDRVKYYDYSYEALLFGSLEITNLYGEAPIGSKYGGDGFRSVNRIDFLDLYQNDIVLVDGRTFTQEELDQGTHVIIVPDDLAIKSDSCLLKDENNPCELDERRKIEVGDKITFDRIITLYPNEYVGIIGNNVPKEKYGEVEYEVIGIYRQENPNIENTFWPTTSNGEITYANAAYNWIYISEKNMLDEITIQNEFKDEYIKNHPETNCLMSDYNILKLQIMLHDPAELNEYVASLNKTFADNLFFYLDYFSSSDSYDAVAGSVEGLSNIAMTIIILSIIISVVILGLTTTLFIKDRNHEMGIYLALGEKKKNIILQIFFEVYLVGFLAISLSLVTGDILGQNLSKEIITSQNKKQEAVIQDKLELLGAVVPEGLEIGMITDGIESNISPTYVISVYGVGSLVFIISVVFPTIYVLKIEPKKILM